jgi:hypothetical protein
MRCWGGLNAAIVPLSSVKEGNEKVRFDSGYFDKQALLAVGLLEGKVTEPLGAITSTLRKGIFDIKADTYVDEGEGVAFVRIGDMKGGLIEASSTAWISHEAHTKERKTALHFGDIVLSKTAYPAASFINLRECNVSQDVVAVKFSKDGAKRFRSGFVTSYLNGKIGLPTMSRFFQGNVQQHLSLDDAKKIELPRLSDEFQERVYKCVIGANDRRKEALTKVGQAETALLKALGLADWAPPEPLAYSASSGDAFVSGRLDAQFFAPRIQQLIDHLSDAGTTIGTVATPRREKFDATKHGDFDYIEIGDLDGTGTTGSSRVAADEAPSRATWFVRPGDIVTSTVRPIRRLSAQIAPDQDGYVCSSGFVVLDPTGVQPELLLTYLRLPVICELMDLFASASMYPAISEPDILALPFPAVDAETEQAVVSAVQEGRAARASAHALLDAAKRAVEIAIEDSEAAALAYLDKMGTA